MKSKSRRLLGTLKIVDQPIVFFKKSIELLNINFLFIWQPLLLQISYVSSLLSRLNVASSRQPYWLRLRLFSALDYLIFYLLVSIRLHLYISSRPSFQARTSWLFFISLLFTSYFAISSISNGTGFSFLSCLSRFNIYLNER